MAGPGQSYDTEQIHAAASKFQTNVGKIGDSMTAIGQYINYLRDNWKGPAAFSFDDLRNQWTKACDDMKLLLDDIAKNTQGTGVSVQDVETSIQKTFMY